jgi:hypothetical protein
VRGNLCPKFVEEALPCVAPICVMQQQQHQEALQLGNAKDFMFSFFCILGLS